VSAPIASASTTVVASSVAQTGTTTDSAAYNRAILASLAKAASAAPVASSDASANKTESGAEAPAAASTPAAAAAPVAAVQQSRAPNAESAKQSVTDVYGGMADFGATVDNIAEEQVLDSSL
jgi:hypothetical protein